MAAQSHYLPALHKLFRTRPVALLSDLRKALQTPSRTTVFRVLSSVGYLASYSHAGRYYTLKRIPQFDPRGLWHYRSAPYAPPWSIWWKPHPPVRQIGRAHV